MSQFYVQPVNKNFNYNIIQQKSKYKILQQKSKYGIIQQESIDQFIENYNISELLAYFNVNKLYNLYFPVLTSYYPVQDYKLPFYFRYDEIFYGLNFQPIEINLIQILTINELFHYYFKLSIAQYILDSENDLHFERKLENIQNNNKNNENSQNNSKNQAIQLDEILLNLFNLTSDFYKKLNKMLIYNENRCIDETIFIRSNLTLLSDEVLNTFSEYHFRRLCSIFDVGIPTEDTLHFLNGGKQSMYDITGYFRNKYQLTRIKINNSDEQLKLLYKRYFKLLFDFSIDPGLNFDILKPIINPPTNVEYQQLKDTVPILSEKQTREWIKKNHLWIEQNFIMYLFATDLISKYASYSYRHINENCWSGEKPNESNRILNKVFNFATPLLIDITVHRIIRAFEDVDLFNLLVYSNDSKNNNSNDSKNNFQDFIYTSPSLMSTSINFERYQVENSEDYQESVLFTFYVQKKTICNPVLIMSWESEIIFPVGTKYILFEHTIYKNGVHHYFGIILT